MLGEDGVLFEDLTGHSSGQQGHRCGRVVRSASGRDLSSDDGEFLCKRNPKGRRGMKATTDCEAPNAFYRA
jgi:hypothetical protein